MTHSNHQDETLLAGQAASIGGWRRYLIDLWGRREFAWFMAKANLTARNASTSLGLLWWVLNPIFMSAVYYFVFGFLFDSRGKDPLYLSYLLAGMFAFNYTTTSMTGGSNSILGGAKLLVNIRFPRLVLPMTAMFESTFGFVTSILAYYLVVFPVQGVYPRWQFLFLPLIIIMHFLFNLGLAAFTARLTIPFRDLNNLIPHLTRLWLYSTPIVWPLSLLDNKPWWVHGIVEVNPMYSFVTLYRWALMGRELGPQVLTNAALWTTAMLIAGVYSFTRNEGNMVRYL